MPPLAESVSRRRFFWFLVALVVVPTLVLASYGITGVMDQSAANEQRLRERYLYQAGDIELGIVATLEEEDGRIRHTLGELPSEQVAPALQSLVVSDQILEKAWVVGDPEMPESLAAAATARMGDLSDRAPVTFVTLDEPSGPATVAVSRVKEGLVVAYQLDPGAIDALVVPRLVGTLFPNEKAYYNLRLRNVELTTPISFSRLRQDLATRMGEEEALVDRPMGPPFASWRITISPSTDPPGRTLRTLWVVLLAATAVVGVWAMGRAIAQQVSLSHLQTDFISSVSHELRTPLTSIRLFIETLQSGRVKDPEKVQECLDVIASESERLSRKIERVLLWARMEAGRRIYEFETVRPVDAVKEVLEAFRAQQLDGGKPVIVDVPAELPGWRIDRDAFAEALLNLLSNARKYGGKDVQIRLRAWSERRFVALEVEDDGPGIPRSERKKIFEKFYRPKILLSQNTQGSGLGLAIVRSVIEAHKGKVTVESEEGKGATFILRFPRV